MKLAAPAPIASEALARIAALYAIEKTIRDKGEDEENNCRYHESICGFQQAAGQVLRTRIQVVSDQIADLDRIFACHNVPRIRLSV